MPSDLNTSNLTSDPFGTIFSPFIDLLGDAFWLIPIGIIAAALYVRTKNISVVGAWLLGAGMFMSSANIFAGYPGVLDFYLFVAVIGVVSIIVGVLLEDR